MNLLQFHYNTDNDVFWYRFSAWPDGAIEVAPFEELAEFLELLLKSNRLTQITKQPDLERPS